MTRFLAIYHGAADAHDDAVAIFAEHPHLQLASGNSIDVLECPGPPGQG